MNHSIKSLCGLIATLALSIAALAGKCAQASQVDLAGPLGSVDFGSSVTVLPNGNFVVAASGRYFDGDSRGAVYLYSADGQLISALEGSSEMDQVGVGGVAVLANGNFVIMSPEWDHGRGAVTWADANTGVSGSVSATNSLVGYEIYDRVGTVTPLRNGNFVVTADNWGGGLGAVTWVDGSVGLAGFVSTHNSLVGAKVTDQVGSRVVELATGDYVVASEVWSNIRARSAGAVTWCSGSGPTSAVVSAANSLVGTNVGDLVGDVVLPLPSGNYVVGSTHWHQGAGSVTWGAADGSTIGAVSASNSLVGARYSDEVGSSITVLGTGDYVVASPHWTSDAGENIGAVSWADGLSGIVGHVDPARSLTGSFARDLLDSGVTALDDGNFVVASPFWGLRRGAVTWQDGTRATGSVVSAQNSMTGASAGDSVGYGGITGRSILGLPNGSYVICSSEWSGGRGAISWIAGGAPQSGVIGEKNSMVGSTSNDHVGYGQMVALASGNYVIGSEYWGGFVGAVTWGRGDRVVSGVVSAENSLIGISSYDHLGGDDVKALPNGNYVVLDVGWTDAEHGTVGAVTWGDGRRGSVGTVDASNSVLGGGKNWQNSGAVFAADNSDYIVFNSTASNSDLEQQGAVSLLRGSGLTAGYFDASNTVFGSTARVGLTLRFAHDAPRDRLFVGRPFDNTVTILKLDSLIRNGFD